MYIIDQHIKIYVYIIINTVLQMNSYLMKANMLKTANLFQLQLKLYRKIEIFLFIPI